MSDVLNPAMTREEFFAAAPPHGVAAVKNGGTFLYGGHAYNLENLGFDMAALENNAVDAAVDSAQKDTRIAELEQRIAELEARKPEPAGEDKALALADAVLLASKTAIERLDEDALKQIAALKGIEEIPDKKGDLVALLKPE